MLYRSRTSIVLLLIFSLLVAACATGAPASPTGSAPPGSESPDASEPAESPSESAGESPADTPIVAPATDVPGKTTVRWFVGLGTGTDPAQVELEQKVISDFNAAHPDINLVLEVINYNASRDTLATEMASGNPPDIVGPVGVSGAEAFHGEWLDLQPLIDSTGHDLTQYGEGSVEFYNVPGEGQVGLPFAIFPSMTYYQKELFDEAGLNYPPHKVGEKYVMPDGTEVDWDFDTLREIAKILTVDANGNDATSAEFDPENIVQYGYEPQYQDIRAIGSYFGAGSLVADDDTTAEIPPQWADAWKWYYSGVWDDHVTPTQAARNGEALAENPFNSGNVAIAISHLWYTCCLADAGENWDIAIVPSHDGEITANFNADTFRILKDSRHPEEAFEVLAYLINDASLELLGVYGGMPARTADQDQYFASLDEKFPWKPDWQVAIDMIPYADNPSFEGFMPNYNKAFDHANTFLTKLASTPDLDLDSEIEAFREELQAIYDEVQ